MEDKGIIEASSPQLQSGTHLMVPIPDRGRCPNCYMGTNFKDIQAYNSLVAGDLSPDDTSLLQQTRLEILQLCRGCPIHLAIQQETEEVRAQERLLETRQQALRQLQEDARVLWVSAPDDRRGKSAVYKHRFTKDMPLVRFDTDDTSSGAKSINAQLDDKGPRFAVDLDSLTVYVYRHGNEDPGIFDKMTEDIRDGVGRFILGRISRKMEETPGLLSQWEEKSSIEFYRYSLPDAIIAT